MGEYVIKLPDVGEGVAEAELVEWQVKVGDLVREDAVLAAVMTDKATVEIPSPVDGEIVWLGAEIGDTVAIGSPIVRLKVAGEGNVKAGAEPGGEAGAKITPIPGPAGASHGSRPSFGPPQVGGGRA
ncbi:biotin/lipoyl-containing protein, partial [Mesorhizobium sp.]|uniref:biotin/lipoyl-containing protein n=1 Tax=Mesorhizobium sp. TaxID=1871066 RepID=UPI0025CDAB61